MKILNNIKLLIFCLGAACLFNACQEDLFPETQEGGDLFTVGGGLPVLLNSSPGFFDLGDIGAAANTFDTFIAGESASSGDLSVSYSGALGSMGPVSLGSVSIPTNVSVSLSEAAAALGISTSDIAIGDVFNVVLTANTSSGAYESAVQTLTASCFSELDGDYAAVTTVVSTGAGIGWDDEAGQTWEGTVRFTSDGAGNYTLVSIDAAGVEWVDISMGAYFAAYNTTAQGNLPEGDLLINDVCNKLTYTGASQWDEIYSFNKLNADGANLTIGWANSYGEAGETVLTRAEGEWPNLTY